MSPSNPAPKPPSNLPQRVASIDIGTNTILLLIVEVNREELRPLVEIETVVGLGKGLLRTGILAEDAMNRAYEALKEYLARCREMGVQKIFAVGTSALRNAGNTGAFLNRVREGLSLSVEVISGEEEAALSFLAVSNDLRRPEKTLLVADVGGGSTELILGKGYRVIQRVSLPMGSVRFTEQFLTSDPVRGREWRSMEEELDRLFPDTCFSDSPPLMVAVGGTATTLAAVALGLKAFDAERIHHFLLTRDTLHAQISLFRSKSIAERKQIPGLFPNRADVILAGAAILSKAMGKTGCSSALVSCHGIRHGLLYQRLGLETVD